MQRPDIVLVSLFECTYKRALKCSLREAKMNKQASKNYPTYDDRAPTITLWSLTTILLIDYRVFFQVYESADSVLSDHPRHSMFTIHHSFYMHRVLGTVPQEFQLKVGTIHILAGNLNKKIRNVYETQQHYRILPRIDLPPSKTQLPCVLQSKHQQYQHLPSP